MQLPFAKYHGAGNDFVIFDDRKSVFPIADQKFIEHLCEHRLGVGADGVILLQSSEKADYRMRIFNADGKEAAQCGNGLRCLVDFIKQMGHPVPHLTIETQERIVKCSWEGDQITVDLGAYIWAHDNFPIEPFSLQLVHTGVPHAVAFVKDLSMPDFQSVASKLRFHAAFAPHGANINFAQIKDGKIYTRTYERGVEEETLACGTGAAAVAVAAMKKYQLKNPICIVPASHEELFVQVESQTVQLRGKATFVFHGFIPY